MNRARATALLFSGAAFAGGVLPAFAQTRFPIRILAFPSENAAEPFFAQEMGLFTKAGLDPTVTATNNDPATVAAIVSNAADVGYASIGTIALAHAKGLPVTVIAPAAEYTSPETRGFAAVMLPQNSPVRSARDLNGKTFAVPGLGAIAYVGARAWMDRNGGDSSTVKFIEVPYPAETDLLNSGRFDAAWITEPFVGDARKVGRVLSLGYDSIAKRFILAAWFTTQQWAAGHPEIVQRYGAVMRETAVWANENRDKSGEILVKVAKLDPQLLATMTRSRYTDRLDTDLMQPIIDMFARYVGFKSFPAAELIYDGT